MGFQLVFRKDKSQIELEWDDSYDIGIFLGVDVGFLGFYDDLEVLCFLVFIDFLKYIQEMKKNVILFFKGFYIEELDFQDDVMVYRLCVEKDFEDVKDFQEEVVRLLVEVQVEVQSVFINNGFFFSIQLEIDLEEECSRDNLDLFYSEFMELK